MEQLERRGFIGWLCAVLGIGLTGSATALASGSLAHPATLEVAEDGKRIKGVGVLRHPPDEASTKAARDIAEMIVSGGVLVLPNTHDSDGFYAWDFRIEGGPVDQVRVERQVACGTDGNAIGTSETVKE